MALQRESNVKATADRSLSLLFVDDDIELASMMQEYISEAGHHLDISFDGRDGLAKILNQTYDLVLLDVMMPHIDGISLLQQVRKRSNVPVILLTARTAQPDRVRGLNAGADDYVPKPFDADELYARIRAVLRRAAKHFFEQRQITSAGPLVLNATTREVRLGRFSIDLTSVEFDLLELLARSPGRIVSRDEITMLIFGREATPYDRFLDVHISHLRKKLEGSKTLIRTIRGIGYMFTGQL
ncbi:MAG TPA: response regulator transcription factor [Terriglobales bacterium]|nr:response regulator transcription factor [Terriglobales bacterium]